MGFDDLKEYYEARNNALGEVDGLYIVKATSRAADFYDALAEEAARE